MNKRGWSDDERGEYDQVVTEALAEASIPARRDIFLAGFDDAIQAHRLWALDVEQDIRDSGADRILKTEQSIRRPRLPVAHDGTILGKVPSHWGVTRRNAEGQADNQRTLFEFMTWQELRDKLSWLAGQIKAYENDAHAVIRLLALAEKVPDAACPADACAQLDITIEDWLMGIEAA